jgi:cytidylate kinase
VRGVVTISASFGAGGDKVGPAVAERLGLPFFDRAVPVTVAQRLAVPLDSALVYDEKAPSVLHRLARAFAYASTPLGPQPLEEGIDDPDRFRQETERILHHIADTTGGVVLGRAGMLVLRDRPDVLRVRLDGPLEARIAQVVRGGNLDEAAARAMQHDVDGAREAYVRIFYHARQSDPPLYPAVLDSTALSLDACVDAIALLARQHLPLSVAAAAATEPDEGPDDIDDPDDPADPAGAPGNGDPGLAAAT